MIHDRCYELMADSLADSTKERYAKHAEYWARFLCIFGLGHLIVDPDEATVCLFASWLSLTNAHSSVRTIVAGVKNFWANAAPCVPDYSEWRKLYRLMKGLKRNKGGTPNRKHPISPEDLLSFKSFIDTSAGFGAALWACMLITWWGMLRKANTTSVPAGEQNPVAVGSCVTGADIEVDTGGWALQLTLRVHKNNQFKEIVHKTVLSGLQGHSLDPVQAFIHHREVNMPAAHLPAFSYVEDGTVHPLLRSQFVSATKALYAAGGGDPAQVSGHSFRRGGATAAFQAGVPEVLMQYHGLWKSPSYKAYVELSKQTRARVTTKMFAMLQRGDQAPMLPSDSPLGHAGVTNECVGQSAMDLEAAVAAAGVM